MAPIHPGDAVTSPAAWSPAAESDGGPEAGIETMQIDSPQTRGSTTPSPVAHGFMAADAASAALEGGAHEADGDQSRRCTATQWRGAAQAAGFVARSKPAATSTSITTRTRARAGPEAAEPQRALTAAVVAERNSKMFVIGAKGPVASGLGPAASNATNLLVHLVVQLVAACSKEHVSALSRSFGNFDRVVAQGWLVADLLGYDPLVEREDAFVLGSAVRNRAKKLKGMERLLRAPQLEEADEAFMHAAVDPPLPFPEAHSAASAASVCGKRARKEPESSAAPPPLSRLRQAAKRAAAEDAGALAAREAARAAWETAGANLEACGDAYDAAMDAQDASEAAMSAAGIVAAGAASVSGRYERQMARLRSRSERAWADDCAAEERLTQARAEFFRASDRREATAARAQEARQRLAAAEDEAAHAAADAAHAAEDAAFHSALEHCRQVMDCTSLLSDTVSESMQQHGTRTSACERENSNLRNENEELRADVEEAWEHIMHMRESCASIMRMHAPTVKWSRQLACERDGGLTLPQMALARSWRDWAHFPDPDDNDWEEPCVQWDGERFVCQPSMLSVYRPLELGMCAGLSGGDAWNAYAEPERTERAARAFRFTCRARRHARVNV